MKQTISLVLLTMFLAGGCVKMRMVEFEHDNVHLDAGGRFSGSKSAAPNLQQILIDVKLAEVKQKNIENMGILDIRWLTNSGKLIAAQNIKNTTPMKSPPTIAGSLVNIGGSVGTGGRGTKCKHGGLLADCEECTAAGGGTGVNIPVIVGSAGKDNENMLSLSATFTLDKPIDLKKSYVALEIQLRKTLNDGLHRRVMLLPMKLQQEDKPTTPQVDEDTVIALLRENRTVIIEGLREGENEADVRKKTPILGNIPLLGKLFKSSDAKTTKQDIIIFITPRILVGRE